MDDTDDTDGSEKLIEVLKTASHNGLIHRGELLGVGCQNCRESKIWKILKMKGGTTK